MEILNFLLLIVLAGVGVASLAAAEHTARQMRRERARIPVRVEDRRPRR